VQIVRRVEGFIARIEQDEQGKVCVQVETTELAEIEDQELEHIVTNVTKFVRLFLEMGKFV
jgi:hypothetical protein